MLLFREIPFALSHNVHTDFLAESYYTNLIFPLLRVLTIPTKTPMPLFDNVHFARSHNVDSLLVAQENYAELIFPQLEGSLQFSSAMKRQRSFINLLFHQISFGLSKNF